MSTFVLIHGAGDVGWYWHLVEAELRARGHETVAPDLPCEDDSAGLRQAAAVDDVAQVTQLAHRMAGASKMVGALAFAAACEHIERASRSGDWKAVLAGMTGFEQERMRLSAYFENRKEASGQH